MIYLAVVFVVFHCFQVVWIVYCNLRDKTVQKQFQTLLDTLTLERLQFMNYKKEHEDCLRAYKDKLEGKPEEKKETIQ